MKYIILLLMFLSFTAGVLGFTLLAGTAALVSRIVFLALLVVTGAMFMIPKREAKPVRATFAQSFTEELPPPQAE